MNAWWISDDTRYSYKIIGDEAPPQVGVRKRTRIANRRHDRVKASKRPAKNLKSARGRRPGSLYAMLSPMMACEEAYLLGKAIRAIDPQAVLVLGPVPTRRPGRSFPTFA